MPSGLERLRIFRRIVLEPKDYGYAAMSAVAVDYINENRQRTDCPSFTYSDKAFSACVFSRSLMRAALYRAHKRFPNINVENAVSSDKC
jgi:hypothetical protein